MKKETLTKLKNLNDVHVKIGIVSLPLLEQHVFNITENLLNSSETYKLNAQFSSNFSESAGTQSVTAQKFAKDILKNLSKYTHYSTAYAKQFFGSNIFDSFDELRVIGSIIYHFV